MLKSLSGGGGGGGGGSPGGSAGSVQYNSGSGFGGASDFTWNASLEQLLIGGNTLTPYYQVSDSDGAQGRFGTDGSRPYIASNVGEVSFKAGTTERARFVLSGSPYLEMIDANGHISTFGCDSNTGFLFLQSGQNTPRFQFQSSGAAEMYTFSSLTGAGGSGVVTATASNAPSNLAPVNYLSVTIGGLQRYIILYG